MLKSILHRLTGLESRFAPKEVPTFEQFQKEWKGMNPVTKSISVLNAENLDDFFGDDPQELPRQKAIREHLIQMGIVNPDALTLKQEAPLLWADYKQG